MANKQTVNELDVYSWARIAIAKEEALDKAMAYIQYLEKLISASTEEIERLVSIEDAAQLWDAARTSTGTGLGDVDDAAAYLAATLNGEDRR